MNKKTFIVILSVFILLTLNFSAAHELDNATDDAAGSAFNQDILESVQEADSLLESSDSLANTQIDVVSNTTFDVIGDYFKIKLSDDDGNAVSNAKVIFTIGKTSHTKSTNGDGIAALQINLNDGVYNVTTKFSGDSVYKSSSKTTEITVNNTRTIGSGLSNSEIQKIIDDAKDRNIILFEGSSYSGINLVINKRLTLISNSNTLLKSSSSSPVITIKGKNASSTIIKGFRIQGNGDGVVISDSDYVRIVNNEISTKGNGIVATGTTYLNITKNKISENSKSGIAVGNAVSTYIFDNTISKNGGNGIEMAKTDKIYIHGNTITGNKKNGIVSSKSANGINYGEEPKNVHINKNTLSKNEGDGILINYAGDNLNIKSNNIIENKGNGISLAHVGSNTIQSNMVTDNWANGIKFFDSYVKPEHQDISYNALYNNIKMDVEAKETYYQETGSRLELGDNWFTDDAGICPKIRSNNLKFTVTQIGPNQFQALFLDSNGNVASLLPDRTLTYTTNNGNKVSITVSGGAGVFTVDANDGDLIKATVDNSRRDNTYSSDSKSVQPINGVTPSYVYPEIPYDSIDGGNGDGSGDGNGNGNGGNGNSNQGSHDNTGNSTHSQGSTPASNANNPINDVSQNYESETSVSADSASGSASDVSSGGSQQQSVMKQIILDEDDIYRVTGISFIVLLIILTIGFYYRDDIKEMNSKR